MSFIFVSIELKVKLALVKIMKLAAAFHFPFLTFTPLSVRKKQKVYLRVC